ncbi:GPW/gp25 family protein [uncultured Thiodictyon sp.]|uniref:GPW/gp25 family protein n=1 Tax=uncultured Thiodictyon sp. TaxID=1846217 RepID=UPI0025D71F82|nr:GPW/gp25 family protein [uncultured Thiodictyon sp.]
MNQELGPLRFDYGFPLRLGALHRQAERVSYPTHVAQMIRQVLLTSPGERVALPEFGCGLRQLLFAAKTAGLATTTELMVRRSLEKFLAGHIRVTAVRVADAPLYGDGALAITVEYTLIETQTAASLSLEVR